MPFLSSRRILLAALCVAGALAALPQSAQAPWSGGLATALWAPLRPATGALAWVRDRVRAPADPYPGLPEELRTALEQRDRLQGELDAAQLHVGQLERELGELSGFRPADRAGWRPRLATVVERSGGKSAGLLGIDIGSAQGVQAGDPVVVGGNQLVGQVAAGGAGGRSWIIPLDDRRCGRIDAFVQPAGASAALPGGAPDAPAPSAPEKVKKGKGAAARGPVLVLLVPQGDRLLVGEMDAPAEVHPGDPVLLSDSAWRPAAQGMRLGLVESVGPLDANPLRRRVSVRMETDPGRLSRVVVKVQDAPGGSR